MLSICVPIYNINVTHLVNSLHYQAKQLQVPYEIVLIDDKSNDFFKNENRIVCNQFNYIELPENIGRAKIRNLFLKYTSYTYLLFLDCDSEIISDFFLQNYVNELKDNLPQIICGGRIYENKKPHFSHQLRWKYGIKRESQPFEIRKNFPNKSFMTNNFVVSRKLFESLRFDERLSEYGHEDTLFGYELKMKNISISHINNPILNNDIESNAEYLEKTKKGLINLVKITKSLNNNPLFTQDIALLKTYDKICTYHLSTVVFVLGFLFSSLIKFILQNVYVSVFLFNLYKLMIFSIEFRKDHELNS